MQTFTAIAIRQNTQIADAGWWNILRAAGAALEQWLGPSYSGQVDFAVANNQSSPASVTGFLLDHTAYRSVIVDYQIRRVSTSTGAVERVSSGQARCTYNSLATAWTWTGLGEGGDGVGLTVLDITSAGQVTYTTDNMAGTYDSVNSKFSYTLRTLT
jgi:hypothetical protein